MERDSTVKYSHRAHVIVSSSTMLQVVIALGLAVAVCSTASAGCRGY